MLNKIMAAMPVRMRQARMMSYSYKDLEQEVRNKLNKREEERAKALELIN